MKHLIYIFAVATLVFSANAHALTKEDCDADYKAMIAETEANRENSLAELNQQLRYTADDEEAASINHRIEQTYHMEEQFRGLAATAHRDCLRHVEASDS